MEFYLFNVGYFPFGNAIDLRTVITLVMLFPNRKFTYNICIVYPIYFYNICKIFLNKNTINYIYYIFSITIKYADESNSNPVTIL